MILLALVLGCAEPPNNGGPDPSVAEDALALLNPARPLELLDELPGFDCETEVFEDGSGLREVMAGCPAVDGELERYADESMAWMEARGLRMRDDAGALRLRFDGAIERTSAPSPGGWITRLELAATLGGASLCGDALCPAPEDAFLADLSWVLLENRGVDEVLVSGTLLLPGEGAIDVEGNWTRDAARCPDEALDGTLLLHGTRTHTLRFDGTCDGCASWSVDGEEPELICGEGG